MTAAGWELGRIGSGQGCLFCNQPVTDQSESCPAFSLAGVAAHRACCGCAAWAGWVRPGLPRPRPNGPPERRKPGVGCKMTGEPELAARVEAELRAQGLRRAVGDPTAIRRIAALLGAEDPGAREKRLAAIRAELAGTELRVRLDDPAGPQSGATPGEAGDDTS